MLSQIYEPFRLYAWIAMPIYLGLVLRKHWVARNRDGLLCVAPLWAIWLVATSVAAWCAKDGHQETWAVFAAIDAVSAIIAMVMAAEVGPRRPLALITISLAAEVAIHILYGAWIVKFGDGKPAARVDYWSCFAIALWQVSVAAKQGGSRAKRGRRPHVHSYHADHLSRSGGLRFAGGAFGGRG